MSHRIGFIKIFKRSSVTPKARSPIGFFNSSSSRESLLRPPSKKKRLIGFRSFRDLVKKTKKSSKKNSVIGFVNEKSKPKISGQSDFIKKRAGKEARRSRRVKFRPVARKLNRRSRRSRRRTVDAVSKSD